jgi:hypothetical protein
VVGVEAKMLGIGPVLFLGLCLSALPGSMGLLEGIYCGADNCYDGKSLLELVS